MVEFILRLQKSLFLFVETCKSIIRVILFSKITKNDFNIVIKKNCVIIGNGPSVNDTLKESIDFFKNKDVFCVNHFMITNYYPIIKPNNYLMLDPAFIDPNHKGALNALDHLVKFTKWDLNLFIPYSYRKSNYFLQKINKNEFIKIEYFNYVIFEGFERLKFWVYKNNLGMPQSQNVLVGTIFKTINLGYEKVYLIGADHTWHENLRLNENNELLAIDAHFYGTKTYEAKDKVAKNESYMASQFLSLHKAFKGYEVLASYSKYRGVKIINASKRSYIDVFEKIKLATKN